MCKYICTFHKLGPDFATIYFLLLNGCCVCQYTYAYLCVCVDMHVLIYICVHAYTCSLLDLHSVSRFDIHALSYLNFFCFCFGFFVFYSTKINVNYYVVNLSTAMLNFCWCYVLKDSQTFDIFLIFFATIVVVILFFASRFRTTFNLYVLEFVATTVVYYFYCCCCVHSYLFIEVVSTNVACGWTCNEWVSAIAYGTLILNTCTRI